MKRRGFLQSLAGFVGLAVAPTLPAKQKPTIVNLPPQIIETGIIENEHVSIFDYLTIDHFGAKDTVDVTPKDNVVTKTYIDTVTVGQMEFHSPNWFFPKNAVPGYTFLFNPETYRTYPLDDVTKNRLHGLYIYTNTNGWALIAASNS